MNVETGPRTWKATCALKYVGAVLHQGWQCLETGEVDWQPVPVEPPVAGRDYPPFAAERGEGE